MKLITFSGVDGSGKSTQLTILQENLEQKGRKVFYFHAIEFSLANRLARTLKQKKSFVPGAEKAVIEASQFSLTLRKLFLFIDSVRFIRFMAQLQRQGYEYVVSDRYFYDSVINILYLSRQHSTPSRPCWFERYIRKPDCAFYMDISAEAIMHRSRIPEQGIGYLKEKIALFNQKKELWQLVSIDATKAESDIARDIQKNLDSSTVT